MTATTLGAFLAPHMAAANGCAFTLGSVATPRVPKEEPFAAAFSEDSSHMYTAAGLGGPAGDECEPTLDKVPPAHRKLHAAPQLDSCALMA